MRKIDAFAHILPRSYLERLERQLEKTMAPSRPLPTGNASSQFVAGCRYQSKSGELESPAWPVVGKRSVEAKTNPPARSA